MSKESDEECERVLQKVAERMEDEMMAALCGANAFKAPRPTALRVTPGGSFEVVEMRDDGSIIEPPKPCPRCGPILLCSEHMKFVT